MTDYRRLLNECPTVVGMLTASVESGGSIDTAIRTVAKEGPRISAEMFSDVVRLTDTKGCPSLIQGLAERIGELPASASGYRHAVLLCIAASESEGSEERLRMMHEASDVALDAVRTMGESYSSSLTMPCMTVFGLGIMVPMILMSIVPMLGTGGMFETSAVNGRIVSAITLALIPSVILALTLMIRRGNPFSSPERTAFPSKGLLLLAAVPLTMVMVNSGKSPEEAILMSVIPVMSITAALLYADVRKERRRRICEDDLKDSVFELGNRMMSGGSFETVCAESLGSRASCTEVKENLERELALCRGNVKGAVRLSVGKVSEEVSRSLIDIHSCSENSGEDAGRLAVALGKQFHNSANVRKSLELRLKSMTDMMIGTAVLFAPMVLGMSVSMLEPLSELAGYHPMENTGTVLSLYLIELCAIISVLTSSLGNREGLESSVWKFCITVPIALMVFAICGSVSL